MYQIVVVKLVVNVKMDLINQDQFSIPMMTIKIRTIVWKEVGVSIQTVHPGQL